MPTVLRKDGFNFVIYPDDHEPMHTHVKKAGKEVIINMGDNETAPHIRDNKKMSKKDVRKALKIAYEYQDYLIEEWKEIYGRN
ncbi:MAG TPA: DUF4160 domain-containing protein [Blastocatellia bacterium]|nr:DUF4160 domain-containing protein [Blastocatellia bacterium]